MDSSLKIMFILYEKKKDDRKTDRQRTRKEGREGGREGGQKKRKKEGCVPHFWKHCMPVLSYIKILNS